MYPAGVIIAITVIAFSFVGDALLDALEVRVEAKVTRGGPCHRLRQAVSRGDALADAQVLLPGPAP